MNKLYCIHVLYIHVHVHNCTCIHVYNNMYVHVHVHAILHLYVLCTCTLYMLTLCVFSPCSGMYVMYSIQILLMGEKDRSEISLQVFAFLSEGIWLTFNCNGC